jgi:tRNA dimethylallyltransferase
MIPILVIEGATASGKSNLAIELACRLKTEIISADSRQIYKYMDIGTAKVTPKQRQLIPHHLIDIITPDQSFNAGQFANQASQIIQTMHAEGKLPIICGGTGLYIRSLLNGLCVLPEISLELRTSLKEQLETDGLEAMYKQLQEIDASFAARISNKDSQRILRGLEVALGTGVPISQHWSKQEKENKYLVYRILLNPPRELLYQRINTRINEMLSSGLIEEIKHLFNMGFNEHSPGLNSLGYKEYLPYLTGNTSLATCAALAAQHHRNYAKRQSTWYRTCTFDLTLADSQVKISEIAHKIESRLIGESHASNSKSV